MEKSPYDQMKAVLVITALFLLIAPFYTLYPHEYEHELVLPLTASVLFVLSLICLVWKKWTDAYNQSGRNHGPLRGAMAILWVIFVLLLIKLLFEALDGVGYIISFVISIELLAWAMYIHMKRSNVQQ